MLHVSVYCQLAWYLNTVSIFGKLRVWNLTTVGLVVARSLALCAPDNIYPTKQLGGVKWEHKMEHINFEH